MLYGKAFRCMYTGSMYGSGLASFAVWGYAVANVEFLTGVVELNPVRLAHIFGGPVEEIERAIELHCAPDPRSRIKEYEGRRLKKVGEYDYLVLNFETYKKLGSHEQAKARKRKWKSKQGKEKTPLDGGGRKATQGRRKVDAGRRGETHIDVDVDVNLKKPVVTGNGTRAHGSEHGDASEMPVTAGDSKNKDLTAVTAGEVLSAECRVLSERQRQQQSNRTVLQDTAEWMKFMRLVEAAGWGGDELQRLEKGLRERLNEGPNDVRGYRALAAARYCRTAAGIVNGAGSRNAVGYVLAAVDNDNTPDGAFSEAKRDVLEVLGA